MTAARIRVAGLNAKSEPSHFDEIYLGIGIRTMSTWERMSVAGQSKFAFRGLGGLIINRPAELLRPATSLC